MKKSIIKILIISGILIAGHSVAAEISQASTGLMQQEHNAKADQKAKSQQQTKGGRPAGVSNPAALSSK